MYTDCILSIDKSSIDEESKDKSSIKKSRRHDFPALSILLLGQGQEYYTT